VFRVFQEALTNVIRHAGATRVDVRIEEATTGLVMTVADDGEGITADKLANPRSLGLLGMRERARRLGGTVTIARREPRGTVVTLELPSRD
jgi:signal transduction histidine kinase